MVKFAASGQDHEVRSFLESLADAAVARGGEGARACSRDKLSISIPAGCVLRLDGTKDQRRPVTLCYRSNAGFVQVQYAATLVDRFRDKVNELNSWYVSYLASSQEAPYP